MAARGSRGRHYNWIPPTSQKDLFDEDDCHLVFCREILWLCRLWYLRREKKIIFPCAYDGPADVFLSSPHRSSSLQAPFTTLLFSFHILSLSLTYFTSPYELFLYYISTLFLSSFSTHSFFLSLSLGVSLFFLSHYFSSFRSFIKN